MKSVWRIGVAGAVVHQGGVLLVRHAYGYKRNLWALPGGYADPGERIDQAAVRELYEETGLQTEVVDIIGLVTQSDDTGGVLYVVLRLRPTEGSARPDGAELEQVGWFTASELGSMTDQELWSDSRRPALAALKGQDGLLDDDRYPSRSERARGFLIDWPGRE